MKILAVVGPPAAGKTTVIGLMRKVTENRVVHFAIDEAHHEICDPTKQDPRYSYSHDGMLILRDRDAMMYAAFALLDRKIWDAILLGHDQVLCVEFSSDNYDMAFKSLPAMLDRGAFILEVLASRATVERRNARREVYARVPTGFLMRALRAHASASLPSGTNTLYRRIFNE